MQNLENKWQAFDTANLTQETTKDLLRLCGYTPTEDSIDIPHTYEDFQALCKLQSKPRSKQELKELISLVTPNRSISSMEITKLLRSGKGMSEDEIREFMHLCNVDKNGIISVDDFATFLCEDS